MRLTLVGGAALVITTLVAGCGGGSGGSSTSQTTVTTTVQTVTKGATVPTRTTVPVPSETVPTSPSTTATAPAGEFTFFRTPSNNIGCEAGEWNEDVPFFVRCDIADHVWAQPDEATCPASLYLFTAGRAEFGCPSDTVLYPDEPPEGYGPPPQTLAYGSSIRVGQIVCTSRPSGIICTNRDGHGFFLSRQRVEFF